MHLHISRIYHFHLFFYFVFNSIFFRSSPQNPVSPRSPSIPSPTASYASVRKSLSTLRHTPASSVPSPATNSLYLQDITPRSFEASRQPTPRLRKVHPAGIQARHNTLAAHQRTDEFMNKVHQENSKLLIFYLICLNPLNLKLSKIREEKRRGLDLFFLMFLNCFLILLKSTCFQLLLIFKKKLSAFKDN